MKKEDTSLHIFPWGHAKRYNDFSSFFKKMFEYNVQKISIDAGFTCPNRDGNKGRGGCTYCNNKTFNPSYCCTNKLVSSQLEKGIAFFARKYESMMYLAYFQAYTNTYAPLKDLKRLYEEALAFPKVIGLVIATRPDCLSPNILDYLEELSKKYYVMVELGIESTDDSILKQINRGHTFQESKEAIINLNKRGIKNCAHMILGLPGDTHESILNQASQISQLPINNLKLHQLQIHRQTVMEHQYIKHPELFHLFTVDEYAETVVDYLELLNPAFIVERFVSQSPAELLVAPNWGIKNYEFVAKVEKRLKERDTWQGRLFSNTSEKTSIASDKTIKNLENN